VITTKTQGGFSPQRHKDTEKIKIASEIRKVGGAEIADRLTGNCRPDPLTFYFFVFSTGSVSDPFLDTER
jgi:hypothetical protein